MKEKFSTRTLLTPENCCRVWCCSFRLPAPFFCRNYGDLVCQWCLVDGRVDVFRVAHMHIKQLPVLLWDISGCLQSWDQVSHFGWIQPFRIHRHSVNWMPVTRVIQWMFGIWKKRRYSVRANSTGNSCRWLTECPHSYNKSVGKRTGTWWLLPLPVWYMSLNSRNSRCSRSLPLLQTEIESSQRSSTASLRSVSVYSLIVLMYR